MIDLVEDEVIDEAEGKTEEVSRYPALVLYENDAVVEKVREYAASWPISSHTMVNLLQMIVFKLG